MEILIFKTNIYSSTEFSPVKNLLSDSYDIQNCTVDLEDSDKVLRIVGEDLKANEIRARVNKFGFLCEELDD